MDEQADPPEVPGRRLSDRLRAAAGFGPAPSPWAHVYRLVLLLGVALAAFLAAKHWGTPDDWDRAGWHRAGAVIELQRLPMQYSGNANCLRCHEQRHAQLAEGRHKGLACESCHGPAAPHVKADAKVGPARVDRGRAACLVCHRALLSRPKSLPQFQEVLHRQMSVSETMACQECHNPHAPTVQFQF